MTAGGGVVRKSHGSFGVGVGDLVTCSQVDVNSGMCVVLHRRVIRKLWNHSRGNPRQNSCGGKCSISLTPRPLPRFHLAAVEIILCCTASNDSCGNEIKIDPCVMSVPLHRL